MSRRIPGTAAGTAEPCEEKPPGAHKDSVLNDTLEVESDDKGLRDLRESFRIFDCNGDGSITAAELTHVMKVLGYKPTEEEVQRMIRQIDTDGNGSVEFNEFLNMMQDTTAISSGETNSETLKQAFRIFDKDNDGMITATEIRYLMSNLGQPLSDKDVDDMILEADRDGNGKIDYDEFTKIVMQHFEDEGAAGKDSSK